MRVWLAALILAAGCGHLGRAGSGAVKVVTVEAEGWSPLDGDVRLARLRAVAEAQKKAVEQAAGVTLSARTQVENATAVRARVDARLRGEIRSYAVLSEGADGAFYKVRIRARVERRPLPLRKDDGAGPKVAVMLANARLAAALREALDAWEVVLVEKPEAADVVVTGVVETTGVADPRLGGFFSYKVKASLKLLRAGTGEVQGGAYEASALDTSEWVARDMALDKAGFLAGSALAVKLRDGAELAGLPRGLPGEGP